MPDIDPDNPFAFFADNPPGDDDEGIELLRSVAEEMLTAIGTDAGMSDPGDYNRHNPIRSLWRT